LRPIFLYVKRRYGMKKKSQLFNGKATRKRSQALGKNGQKKIAEQIATIIEGFPGGLPCLMVRFCRSLSSFLLLLMCFSVSDRQNRGSINDQKEGKYRR
jgi:hypothetical protein